MENGKKCNLLNLKMDIFVFAETKNRISAHTEDRFYTKRLILNCHKICSHLGVFSRSLFTSTQVIKDNSYIKAQ
jgi:hypothetical protein